MDTDPIGTVKQDDRGVWVLYPDPWNPAKPGSYRCVYSTDIEVTEANASRLAMEGALTIGAVPGTPAAEAIAANTGEAS